MVVSVVLVALAGTGLVGAHLTGLVDLDPRPAPAATTSAPDRVALSDFYTALTGALHTKDRDAFFAHVRGAATAPLTRWWDNMDVIGWTTGRMAPVQASGRHVAGPDADVRVLLGTDMRFGQYAPDGRGDRERVIHGFEYRIRVDVTGPEPMIIEFEPVEGLRPWDAGPLATETGDGVVLAALGGDRRHLADLVGPAEEAAAWVLADHAAQHDREAPLDGFVVFVTADPDRYRDWFSGPSTDSWDWEPAGYAFSGVIPGPERRWAGAMVVIGPQTVEYPAGAVPTLVHEFAHVVQAVDHPATRQAPLVASEGWAVHQELRYLEDVGLAGYWARDVADCVSGTPVVPQDRDFRGEDASCAYALAPTVFAYAAEQGLDPAELAEATAAGGVDPFAAATDLGVELTDDGWAAWLEDAYAAP